MCIFKKVATAILKFVTVVVVPATYLLIKGFIDSMFPSSAREIFENS